MLSSADTDLVRRDPLIPGLATLLDPEAFIAKLRQCVTEVNFQNLQITYLRYKPGMDCLATYQLDVAGAAVEIYAKAHGLNARNKLQKARKLKTIPGALGLGRIILEDLAIVVSIFPNDSKLKGLRRLGDGEKWKDVLRKLLPNQPDLWEGTVRSLRYKPKRRYVAQLLTKDGARAVLKFYTDLGYHTAQGNAKAFRSCGPLHLARLIGRSNRHRILAFEWLSGRLLSEAILDPELELHAVMGVGAALAELHGQNPEGLKYLTRESEAATLLEVATGVGWVCPHLARQAHDLARRLAAHLMQEPAVNQPIHGDFYAKQVLIDGNNVAILDYDWAALGDPTADIGNFIAHLERDVLNGKLYSNRVESLKNALIEGYEDISKNYLSPLIILYTAVGLLRLALDPFRYREPNWPERTEAILDRAEAILKKVSTHTPSTLSSRERKVEGGMKVFTRDDGRTLQVVRGFREQVLSAPRVSVHPKPEWSYKDYSAAVDKKLQHSQKMFSEFARWVGALDGARVLEVGCGDGINCLQMGFQPVRQVVGIDLKLPLFEPSEKGEKARRLTCKVLEKLGLRGNIGEVLNRLPVRFDIMDVTLMTFPNDSFDFLMSHSAMEHLIPIEKALTEMARVVRPGGLIYHAIDPYFWLKGCHKKGVVDIPWAHARLSLEEFRRFVTENEGEIQAVKRCQYLETLNQFTLRQWRRIIESGPFDVLEWKEEPSPFAEGLLEEHLEVEDSLLEGVERRDLIHGRIKMWLRK